MDSKEEFIYPQVAKAGECMVGNGGLTLRDHIAIEAMKSLIVGRSWDGNGQNTINSWSKSAYLTADAMLEARNAGH